MAVRETEGGIRLSCRPGAPLQTCGEFVFLIDSTNVDITSFLGNRQAGVYVYPELKFAPDNVFPFFNTCNFTGYIYHFRHHLTTQIYDLRGRLILDVQDNKWQLFRNAAGKFNYDTNGPEVYDKEGRIAFHLNFVNGDLQSLFYEGIIPCGSSTLSYYTFNFNFSMPFGTPALNAAFDHLYDSVPLHPLFRYTGKDWQHSRL